MPTPTSSPPADALVFASLPLALIAYGAVLGVDRVTMVESSGLSREELADPDTLVDYESLIRLWEVLLERFPARALGLDYASYLTPRALGVVGYACTHCRDLGQALQLYARYCRLADPRVTISLEHGDGQTRVALSHEPRVEAMAEPIEMMIAAVAFTARRMNPGTRPPLEVCFRHERRHDPARYQEVFECPVRFGAAWTGATFSPEALSLPIMGADPRIGKYLQQQVEAMHQQRDPAPMSEPLDARVREAIDEGLLADGADQARVARTLGLSARSLQRGLAALNTSFSDQLDAVRRTRALQLLDRRELSVREIAFMLGYSDPRAFYRSFRRWTGQTPAEHRRESRAPS